MRASARCWFVLSRKPPDGSDPTSVLRPSVPFGCGNFGLGSPAIDVPAVAGVSCSCQLATRTQCKYVAGDRICAFLAPPPGRLSGAPRGGLPGWAVDARQALAEVPGSARCWALAPTFRHTPQSSRRWQWLAAVSGVSCNAFGRSPLAAEPVMLLAVSGTNITNARRFLIRTARTAIATNWNRRRLKRPQHNTLPSPASPTANE